MKILFRLGLIFYIRKFLSLFAGYYSFCKSFFEPISILFISDLEKTLIVKVSIFNNHVKPLPLVVFKDPIYSYPFYPGLDKHLPSYLDTKEGFFKRFFTLYFNPENEYHLGGSSYNNDIGFCSEKYKQQVLPSNRKFFGIFRVNGHEVLKFDTFNHYETFFYYFLIKQSLPNIWLKSYVIQGNTILQLDNYVIDSNFIGGLSDIEYFLSHLKISVKSLDAPYFVISTDFEEEWKNARDNETENFNRYNCMPCFWNYDSLEQFYEMKEAGYGGYYPLDLESPIEFYKKFLYQTDINFVMSVSEIEEFKEMVKQFLFIQKVSPISLYREKINSVLISYAEILLSNLEKLFPSSIKHFIYPFCFFQFKNFFYLIYLQRQWLNYALIFKYGAMITCVLRILQSLSFYSYVLIFFFILFKKKDKRFPSLKAFFFNFKESLLEKKSLFYKQMFLRMIPRFFIFFSRISWEFILFLYEGGGFSSSMMIIRNFEQSKTSLTHGMLQAGNVTAKKIISSQEEILAIKYATYIKTFFSFMPKPVSYYSKDEFLPMVNMLNWVCTHSPEILRTFTDQFKKCNAAALREAYVKGTDLNFQEKSAFYDSAHYCATEDAPRISDVTNGIQAILDIRSTKDASITHFFGYGARLCDNKGKILHPDAIKENGTIVDCCKADSLEIVSKHTEKEQKYTANTSLDYETLNVQYSTVSVTPKIPISNLVQEVYPQILPPDIPFSYPFPVPQNPVLPSTPVQSVYPQIYLRKTKEYKQEMNSKFKSFPDMDFSNLQ